MTRFSPRQAGDPYRYGVFLRPDPRTSLAVTTVTTQLRAQFGFISADAFPPHATLVGSQHIGRDEDTIVEAVTKAVAPLTSFPVVNSGIRRLGDGGAVVYDVHHLADGTPNTPLVELAAAIDTAVAPLRRPAEDPEPNLFDRQAFRAHLSLASHDLRLRPDLSEEAEEFIHGLGVEVPPDFPAEYVSLYRTRSDDWSGRYWLTLTWTHLHTWRLPRAD
ncbi:2'-5' RNA ligase family protein [Pseudonocardia sp. CA-142604]|uniref:2'-5' RNA ligase family protein n=1 Tax=Pseudonocardia sp. CA-142604 TaxID=3240024 RepID=UPI003D8A08FE